MEAGEEFEMIWIALLRAATITDLERLPITDEPHHKDVKMILKMYSLESFLFKKLNKACRDRDNTAIDTLGPFAHVLMSVIDQASVKRNDRAEGPFFVFRGL